MTNFDFSFFFSFFFFLFLFSLLFSFRPDRPFAPFAPFACSLSLPHFPHFGRISSQVERSYYFPTIMGGGHNPDSESIDLSSTTPAASGSPGNQSASSSSSSSDTGATTGDYVPGVGASPITQATTRENDSPVTGAQIALHHHHHDHPADPVAPETATAAHLDDKLPPVPGSLITQVSKDQEQPRAAQSSSGGFWRNLLSCCVQKRSRTAQHGAAGSGQRYTGAVSRSKPVLPPFVCPFSTPPPSCLSLARFSVNFEMRPESGIAHLLHVLIDGIIFFFFFFLFSISRFMTLLILRLLFSSLSFTFFWTLCSLSLLFFSVQLKSC